MRGRSVMLLQASFWWPQMSDPHFTSCSSRSGADIQAFQLIPIPGEVWPQLPLPSGEWWDGCQRQVSRHSQWGLCLKARKRNKAMNYTTAKWQIMKIKQNPSPILPLLPHRPHSHTRIQPCTHWCACTRPFSLRNQTNSSGVAMGFSPGVTDLVPRWTRHSFQTWTISCVPKIWGRSCRDPCGKRRVRRFHQPKDHANKWHCVWGLLGFWGESLPFAGIPVPSEISHQSRNQLLPIKWDLTFELVKNSSP